MSKIFVIILLLFTSELFSQEYIIREYRKENELANQFFLYGVEMPGPILYFLSKDKFISYDGDKFTSLYNLEMSKYPRKKILRDEFDNLWFIGKDTNFVFVKFDGHSFEKINFPEKINSLPIFTVSNGKIFLGGNAGEFYYYQKEQWHKYDLPKDFRNAIVTDMQIIDENLFISTKKGMFYFKADSFSSYKKITPEPVHTIYYDKNNGKTYMLMNKAFGIYQSGKQDIITNNISIINRYDSFYINRISNDNLVIGAGVSHYLFNETNKSFEVLENVIDIKTHRSTYSFKDSFNNIWITSPLGLTKATKSVFKTYKKSDGLWENDVTAIAQFDNGDVILAHKKGLTLVKDRKFIKVPILKTISGKPPHIIDLIIDSKQRVWFVIQYEGIGRIDDINAPEQIKWFRPEIPENHKYNSIQLLKNDDIFLTTGSVFFNISDDSVKQLCELNPNLRQYSRRAITISDSIIVIAGKKGLIFYNINKNKIKGSFSDIRELFSVCLYKNKLLIGGKEGLYEFNDEQIKPFLNFNKFKSHVYFIKYVKQKDKLWVGTNKGLYKWGNSKWENYQVSEGLPDNEINRSAFLFNTKTEEIWVGTIGGLAIFQDSLAHLYKTKPVLKIKNFIVNDESVNPISNIIESNDGNIDLDLKGISLYNNPEINYEATLSGLDIEYAEEYLTDDNGIVFENFPNGFYEFQAFAFDKFGNKSEAVKINLKVNKQNWSAILYVFLLLFGLVLTIIIWRKKANPGISPTQEKEIGFSNKSYNIITFGNFSIALKENQDLGTQFSPQSKELLILLILNSFNGNSTAKGITSEKIGETIWREPSTQSTKNKRNLAIKKLRELLSKNELGIVEFYDNKWILKLNENIAIDYFDWQLLRKKLRAENLTNQGEIKNFLSVIRRGTFLSNQSFHWIEDIKTWHNNESVQILSRIIRKENFDLDLRLETGEILNAIDPLNESEMKYYINLLHKSEKHSKAAYVYEQFCNEYQKIFNKNYKLDLNEIVST